MTAKIVKSAQTKPSKTPAKKTVAVAAKTAPKAVRAKAPARPTLAMPAARAVAPAAPVKPAITSEQYYELVRLEAYLLSERDGFKGDPNAYWRAAELKVAATMSR